MTQQSLIARLKAVEEALAHSIPNVIGDFAYHTRKHNSALFDLRELIKKAEVQEPVGVVDIYIMNETPIRRKTVPTYTALGEKPAEAEQKLAKESDHVAP